jgi:hypothetical protein
LKVYLLIAWWIFPCELLVITRGYIPSGKQTVCCCSHGPVEIVDLTSFFSHGVFQLIPAELPSPKAWVDFSDINFEAQLLSVEIAFGEALDASRCLLALRSCAPDAGLAHGNGHGGRSATGRRGLGEGDGGCC